MKLKILVLSIALALGNVQAQNNEALQTNNLKQGGVDLVWNKGYTGSGSTIGIIDQGFDINNTDLKSRVAASMNMLRPGAVTSGTHGTAMASIAAGAKNNMGTIGVAPDATLLLAQAGWGGSNLALDQRAVKTSLDWLSGRGATVINMSFGSAYDATFLKTVRYNPTSKVYMAPAVANNIADFKTATDRGSVLVFASGNQGLPFSQYPGVYAVQTDAAGKLVLGGKAIIVGAVDANNVISSYSNRAGHICINSVNNSCRDTVQTMNYFVVAPGDKLLAATPGGGTAYVAGTSGAAAYVSGGIALLRQVWPQLKPEQLVSVLLNSTRDLGAAGVDTTYGRGLVDFESASRSTGRLTVSPANFTIGTGSATGSALTSTGIGGGIATNFRGTSLSTTQVLDELGRHYTADLTKAVFKTNMMYDSLSPYLAFAGYRPAALQMGDYDLTVLAGGSGSAVLVTKHFGKFALNYQMGSMQESHGFTGNYGTGALDLGSSATTWNILGMEYAVTDSSNLVMSYGQGVTRVTNQPGSMLMVTSPVGTDTWQVGLRSRNFMRHNDQIGFGLAGEVRVKSGTAMVTTVTGYEFRETDNGDVLGSPIVVREQVNLVQKHQPVLWANYRVPMSNSFYMLAGAAANQNGYKLGVNLTWIQ
jgi:subtilisin family serine protease